MRFAEEDTGDHYRIRAYGPGEVRVNDEVLHASLVVGPDRLVREWSPRRAADIDQAAIDHLLSFDPEVLILGTGARLVFPPAGLLQTVMARGVGLEVMDTASACRTYNILMAEERRVVAGLLMIEEE